MRSRRSQSRRVYVCPVCRAPTAPPALIREPLRETQLARGCPSCRSVRPLAAYGHFWSVL